MDYILAFIIGLSLLGILLLSIITIEPAKKLKKCAERTSNNFQRLDKYEPAGYQFCLDNKQTISHLKGCYENVQRQSVVPVKYIEFFADKAGYGFQTLEEFINYHNDKCPTQKIPVPSF